MIINFGWLEGSYCTIEFTLTYKHSLTITVFSTACHVHQPHWNSTLQNQIPVHCHTLTPQFESTFGSFALPTNNILSNVTGNSTTDAIHFSTDWLTQGTWPWVHLLTLQIITIILIPPGLATSVAPLLFHSSYRGFPRMRGIPSVVGGLYVQAPCRFIFWYLESDVWQSPWWYQMILASYMHYHTAADGLYLLLQWWVALQPPLERSLTISIYRVKLQCLYHLASGNIDGEVPLESWCH